MKELITKYGIDTQDSNHVEYIRGTKQDWYNLINHNAEDDDPDSFITDVKSYLKDIDYESVDLLIGDVISGEFAGCENFEIGDVMVHPDDQTSLQLTDEEVEQIDQAHHHGQNFQTLLKQVIEDKRN